MWLRYALPGQIFTAVTKFAIGEWYSHKSWFCALREDTQNKQMLNSSISVPALTVPHISKATFKDVGSSQSFFITTQRWVSTTFTYAA
jgi:hypothetical protein